MYVAMKDLEIRGAGNLLGGEQSGHIDGVGFDLYVRMVGEAVADVQGRGAARTRPPTSRSTCRSTRTCRTTTSRSSGCGWRCTASSPRRDAEQAVDAVRDELTDRYGPPPEPVANLLRWPGSGCSPAGTA